jgi:hypothetical protein
MIKFAISTKLYTGNDNGQFIWRNDNVLGYIFINTGNCVLRLNNYKLNPGGVYKTFETNCQDTTKWQIIWESFNPCSITNAELTTLIYEKVL